MKAYELTATVTADGQIKLPDFRLSPNLSQTETVKVIILVTEQKEKIHEDIEINENFSEESFERSWQQAITDETIPLSELWEETEVV